MLVYLCDKTGYMIKASFWNENAQNLEKYAMSSGTFKPFVIVTQQIKIVAYMGLSLNCHEDCTVVYNDKSKKAIKLMKWYLKL